MSEIGKRNRNVVIADVNKYDSISRNSIHTSSSTYIKFYTKGYL